MASYIYSYPQHIQNAINDKIEQGASLRNILDMLKAEYASELSNLPAIDTLNNYRKQYLNTGKVVQYNTEKQKLQREFNTGLAELDKLLTQVKDRQALNYSNVNVLQGLMGKCLLRLNDLEHVQSERKIPDMQVEKQILAYMEEARSYVKTIVSLTSDLAAQQAKMDDIVKKETKFILSTVSNIILQICPDRYETFTTLFKAALLNEGRDLNNDNESE